MGLPWYYDDPLMQPARQHHQLQIHHDPHTSAERGYQALFGSCTCGAVLEAFDTHIPGHAGDRHGGPADDKPGNRASWPTMHDDSNYPGERTVLSLAELRTAFVCVVRQRDQVIGARQQDVDFAAAVTDLAASGTEVPAQHLADVLTRIPEWARPKEAAL